MRTPLTGRAVRHAYLANLGRPWLVIAITAAALALMWSGAPVPPLQEEAVSAITADTDDDALAPTFEVAGDLAEPMPAQVAIVAVGVVAGRVHYEVPYATYLDVGVSFHGSLASVSIEVRLSDGTSETFVLCAGVPCERYESESKTLVWRGKVPPYFLGSSPQPGVTTLTLIAEDVDGRRGRRELRFDAQVREG